MKLTKIEIDLATGVVTATTIAETIGGRMVPTVHTFTGGALPAFDLLVYEIEDAIGVPVTPADFAALTPPPPEESE